MHYREGMHGRGHVWFGVCMAGLCAWPGVRWACVAGELATTEDGTHPTGMHSCNTEMLF